MTEPRLCQDCGRAPVVSHELPNHSSSKGTVALVCPNCLSSTPHFSNYREALTNWNLKQISAEELFELKQMHRAELESEMREELFEFKQMYRQEIREELKQELRDKLLDSVATLYKFQLVEMSDIFDLISDTLSSYPPDL
jgi:hypothetical protein